MHTTAVNVSNTKTKQQQKTKSLVIEKWTTNQKNQKEPNTEHGAWIFLVCCINFLQRRPYLGLESTLEGTTATEKQTYARVGVGLFLLIYIWHCQPKRVGEHSRRTQILIEWDFALWIKYKNKKRYTTTLKFWKTFKIQQNSFIKINIQTTLYTYLLSTLLPRKNKCWLKVPVYYLYYSRVYVVVNVVRGTVHVRTYMYTCMF